MSEARASAARRLANRLMVTIRGLRYIECRPDELKPFQRRLRFLHRHGVHCTNEPWNR